MDYQFSHDILGHPIATCELECEAFGDWLSNDIAQDFTQITLLLDTVHQLQNNQLINYQHNGKEYHLLLDKDEVELLLNNNHIQNMAPSEDDESQELADLHIQSGCGLADFYKLLKAWQKFVS
ncbi:YacL family protein [Paraglaciecola arctica]|uniref:Uncharacterized protein n=1 Tax=Paraglaciecola arctica BSs20135 TaxID=493475 RepID=K6YSW2_9ALTE|nr:YacL family protein [Paraglaciecola arctica]GAC21267.1 hypothetical protein GARC_4325 [Paraglaciecola arctica BSs20135]